MFVPCASLKLETSKQAFRVPFLWHLSSGNIYVPKFWNPQLFDLIIITSGVRPIEGQIWNICHISSYHYLIHCISTPLESHSEIICFTAISLLSHESYFLSYKEPTGPMRTQCLLSTSWLCPWHLRRKCFTFQLFQGDLQISKYPLIDLLLFTSCWFGRVSLTPCNSTRIPHWPSVWWWRRGRSHLGCPVRPFPHHVVFPRMVVSHHQYKRRRHVGFPRKEVRIESHCTCSRMPDRRPGVLPPLRAPAVSTSYPPRNINGSKMYNKYREYYNGHALKPTPTWTHPQTLEVCQLERILHPSLQRQKRWMVIQKGMARKAERWPNHSECLIPIAALGCPVLCAGLDCGVSHSWGKSKDSPAAAPDKARGYSVTQESNS